MRLGIVLQSQASSGGSYSFENAFLAHLRSACETLGLEYLTFVPATRGSSRQLGQVFYKRSTFRMALARLRGNPLVFRLLSFMGLGASHLERVALKNGVDLLLFASPNHLAVGICQLPIATTVWDFGHLDLPQAQELSLNGLWAWRETYYRSTLRRSTVVFCDSEATSRRLRAEYQVPSLRIKKIGLLPEVSDYGAATYDRPHFLYPAMFWHHKNHHFLLRAFRRLIDSESDSSYLVFTGEGIAKEKVRQQCRSLGVEDLVLFEGLVSREKLLQLMKGSVGVVMPSLLGPSNLPPLEAALLGVPSVISDSHDMGDLLRGGTYLSPFDEGVWTDAMKALLRFEVPLASAVEIDAVGIIRETLHWLELQIMPWRDA